MAVTRVSVTTVTARWRSSSSAAAATFSGSGARMRGAPSSSVMRTSRSACSWRKP
jgi:hypothetical protein